MPASIRLLGPALLSLLAACSTRPAAEPGRGALPAGSVTTGLGSPSGPGIVYPFNGDEDVKWQVLYVTTEVGAAGPIAGLRFHRGTTYTGAVTCPSVMVRLGHTTLEPYAAASVTSSFAANVDAGVLTTVFSGALTIPSPGDAWFDVPFTTPFDYDGVDSLLVEIETYRKCSASLDLSYFVAPGGNRRVTSYARDADPSFPDHDTATGWRNGEYAAAQFVFAGGDLRKDLGGTSAWSLPLASNMTNGSRQQNLYLASDLRGAGYVTGVGLQLYSPSVATTITTTVRMGHSTLTQLGTSFADNVDGSLVTLADHLTWSIPGGIPAGSWLWLPLNGEFRYDGVRNLIVEFETGPQSTMVYQLARTLMRTGSVVYATNAGAATGSLERSLAHLALRFAGAPVVLAPVHGRGGSLGHPVGGSSPGGQVLSVYKSGSFGTGGTITKLALRHGVTPVPTTVPNVKIYMGTTTRMMFTLADVYANNLDGATLVYSGPLAIPGGVSGDWVDVPLQTGFAYDPTRHLTILFTSDAAPSTVNRAQTWLVGESVGRNDNAVGLGGSPGWSSSGSVAVKLTVDP